MDPNLAAAEKYCDESEIKGDWIDTNQEMLLERFMEERQMKVKQIILESKEFDNFCSAQYEIEEYREMEIEDIPGSNR